MKALPEVVMLDPKSIRVFVSRARGKEKWEEMKDSMAALGLKQPIEVRDITHLPPAERKREGGHYKYELNFGEGRLKAALALGWEKIPAMVAKVNEIETVGRFLAENLIRDPLPWYERARLVADDLADGMTPEAAARKFSISRDLVARCQKIVSKTAQGLEEDVAAMPMAQAEALTKLPARDQTIVMEVFRETGERQIGAFLKKAQAITDQGEELSPTALKASLERVKEELKRSREVLRLKRLHHSLGPQNLQIMLGHPKFRKACAAAGVNVRRFEEVTAR